MSRHVKVIYWFKEMDVALPPFFQKNIVVGIVIYSIGNGFVFDIVIVSRHWFHWRGRCFWLGRWYEGYNYKRLS